MSHTFYSAFGVTDHKSSIILYDREIADNPENFAAWNNRGLRKIHWGKEQRNQELISDGIKDLEEAIRLAYNHDGKDFEGARNNIEYARSIMF